MYPDAQASLRSLGHSGPRVDVKLQGKAKPPGGGSASCNLPGAGRNDRTARRLTAYMQPGNLNDAMRVFQLNAPVLFRYSVVYQKVQSSTGSTVIAL